MPKFRLLTIVLILTLIGGLLADQIRHPQELDLSDLEDEELLNWAKKENRNDCASYYRRIVKHLFNQRRFQPDPRSPTTYVANVPLRMTKDQWLLLVENDIDGLNMNEVDNLLVEVLKQSQDEKWEYPVAEILLDHYRHQLIESLPSLNSPIVLIAIAVLVIIMLNRAFHFSKLTYSAIIILVILNIVIISYVMTYLDCQNDLEVEQMIQLSKRNSANNPCKDYDGEQQSSWSSLRAFVFGSSENKCLEYMRNTFKGSKKYCDPLDVFAKWFGKIQMSYISSILGGFLEIVSNLTASSNFLTKIILWSVASIVFLYLFLSLGKSVIKHSFQGFFNARPSGGPSSEPDRDSIREFERLNLKLDEIYKENKQMKRELSMIREISVERTIEASSSRIHHIPTVEERMRENKHLPDIVEEQTTRPITPTSRENYYQQATDLDFW